MDKLVFENIFRSDEVNFNESGLAVCPYCNGTGLNDDFNFFHKVSVKLKIGVIACCLKCYGKGQTDWVEIANGRIDEVMMDLFYNSLGFSALHLVDFLRYVYAGYVVPAGNEIQLWYDEDEDEWKETTGIDWSCHIESKNEINYWINKFTKYSYLNNPESFYDLLSKVYDPDLDYEGAAKIKSKILSSTELNIDDLVRMRKELYILGFTIESLNEICICDESGKIIETDFAFSWRNLLDKFKLPHLHKYSRVPEGVLTVD